MENHHKLTLALQRPERLLVELDEHILLTFTGANLETNEGATTLLDPAGSPALEISGFVQCVCDARLYGSPEATAKVYRAGTVAFVSER